MVQWNHKREPTEWPEMLDNWGHGAFANRFTKAAESLPGSWMTWPRLTGRFISCAVNINWLYYDITIVAQDPSFSYLWIYSNAYIWNGIFQHIYLLCISQWTSSWQYGIFPLSCNNSPQFGNGDWTWAQELQLLWQNPSYAHSLAERTWKTPEIFSEFTLLVKGPNAMAIWFGFWYVLIIRKRQVPIAKLLCAKYGPIAVQWPRRSPSTHSLSFLLFLNLFQFHFLGFLVKFVFFLLLALGLSLSLPRILFVVVLLGIPATRSW